MIIAGFDIHICRISLNIQNSGDSRVSQLSLLKRGLCIESIGAKLMASKKRKETIHQNLRQFLCH